MADVTGRIDIELDGKRADAGGARRTHRTGSETVRESVARRSVCTTLASGCRESTSRPRSEGEALGDKLRAADVETVTRTFPGVTHEIFGMGAAVDEARNAVNFAAQTISAYFGQKPQ